ncbi:MAG TPA: carboxypeptidase-like regulatory domain-containing protein, partial [Bryobacteraceae bacterium]|nr:carboxypeptidase-like regulatory domain-containing protein [Bryobacteraceae bacterium]
MPQHRILKCFLGLTALWLAAAVLYAAEQHGTVKSGSLPIPGATITATMDDKKLVTTTDDQGNYTFPDIDTGVWKMTVEMLGFESQTKQIGVSPDAPSPQWDLKLLDQAGLTAQLDAKTAAAAAAAPPAAAPAVSAPAPAASAAATPAPASAAPAAASSAAAPASAQGASQAAANGRGGRGARGQAAQAANGRGSNGRGGANNNNGRPSLLGAYQEVGVSQSAETSAFSGQDTISSDMSAQLSQSADQSFVVQGSQSTAMGMAGVADFGGGFGPGGPGGFGGDFGGRGGFGGPEGLAGAGGDAGGLAGLGGQGGDAGAGGGRGFGGGGPGGGGRGGPGGGGGFAGGGRGGGGGFGGPGGGFGGRGGGGAAFAGGRGGRGGFQGRAGAMAFGNNRRSARQLYSFNLNVSEANSILNAQTYSLSGQDLGKPYMNRTNVTGNIGGPLKIPKVINGNNGQFQVNFTVGRSRNGNQGNLTTMPSQAERLGNFQGVPATNGQTAVIYDPTTCTASGCAPFPNNTIPTLNPISAQLLKFYPFPNLPGLTRNYEVPTTPLTNTNTLNSRFQQTLNAKNRITLTLAWQGTSGTTPNSLLMTDPFNNQLIVDSNNGSGINASTTYAHNFTTRLINSLAFTFSRQAQVASPYFSGLTNVEQQLGIAGVATDPLNWGPPGINFTNYGGLSERTASNVRQQTSSATDSLTWVRGKHTLQFGGAFRRQHW